MRSRFLAIQMSLISSQFCLSPAFAADQKLAGNVTEARVIKESEAGKNWLVNGGRYTGEHFSPLDQINAKNVEELGLAWATTLPSLMGLQAEPIVVDGVVYLSGTLSVVWALDAKTGEVLWSFDPGVDLSVSLGTSISARYNRGVAVWEGAVYVGTADCRLVAIDAARGTKLWESVVCDSTEAAGAAITGAPRVGAGKVFMGYAASDFGARGSLAAFDPKTGKELWRFWTVPGNPAQEFESEMLEKASYLPDKLYFQDAFHLFSKFKVNFEQSWNLINQTRNASLIAQRDSISSEWDFNRTGLFGGLLGIFSDNKNTTEDERIDLHTSLLYSLSACEWLKQNPNLWEDYIVPNV